MLPPAQPLDNPDLGLIADTPPVVSVEAAEAFRLEILELEVRKHRDTIEDLSQNRGERKKYARKLFIVLICWLVLVAYVVLAQGFSYGAPFGFGTKFHLSDTVIVALLTTATGSIIGVFLIVVNYLFPKH